MATLILRINGESRKTETLEKIGEEIGLERKKVEALIAAINEIEPNAEVNLCRLNDMPSEVKKDKRIDEEFARVYASSTGIGYAIEMAHLLPRYERDKICYVGILEANSLWTLWVIFHEVHHLRDPAHAPVFSSDSEFRTTVKAFKSFIEFAKANLNDLDPVDMCCYPVEINLEQEMGEEVDRLKSIGDIEGVAYITMEYIEQYTHFFAMWRTTKDLGINDARVSNLWKTLLPRLGKLSSFDFSEELKDMKRKLVDSA